MGPRRSRGHSLHAPAVPAGAALLVTAVVAAALLAACGGSSGGAVVILPSPDVSSSPLTASAAATPEGTPLTGTPRQAIATFWRLVDANDYAALAAAAAPGAPGLPTADNDDIERVELVRTVRVERQPGMALVQVDVRVDPSSAATPWGDPGRHTLFVRLLEQSPGKWLVAGWGTSP